MGRQINFFMMPEDVAELDAKVKEMGFVIVADRMPTKDIILYNSLCNDIAKQKYLFLPEEESLLSKFYIETKNEYAILPHLSPVIEFWQPPVNKEKNKLNSGRLYYNTEFVNDNKKFQKHNINFIHKAETLFKWYRYFYRKGKINGNFVCTYAQKWMDEKNGKYVIDKGQSTIQY